MGEMMQYSPKLKKAAEEIKEILSRYDIAGLITLHTPGHAEFINEVSPSYSCLTITEDMARVKTKRADFATKQEWEQKINDTVNMVGLFRDMSARHFSMHDEIFSMLEKVVEIEQNDGGFTSNTTQNN